jgi:hypothetical protein
MARSTNQMRADAFDGEKGKPYFSSASFWWWLVLIFGLVEITAALLSGVIA